MISSTEAQKSSQSATSGSAGAPSTTGTDTTDIEDDVPTESVGKWKEKTGRRMLKTTETAQESTSVTTEIEKSTADELKDMNNHGKINITSTFSTPATTHSKEETVDNEMESTQSTDSQSKIGAEYVSTSSATASSTATPRERDEIITESSTDGSDPQSSRRWRQRWADESGEEDDNSAEMESKTRSATPESGRFSSYSTATATHLKSEEITTVSPASTEDGTDRQNSRWWQSFRFPWWTKESGEREDISAEMESKETNSFEGCKPTYLKYLYFISSSHLYPITE